MEFLQQRSHILYLAIFIGIIFSSIFLQKLFQPRLVYYSIDNKFSCMSKAFLKSNLSSLVKKRTTATKVLEHAQAIVPVVNNVSVIYKANRSAQLKLRSQDPHAVIISNQVSNTESGTFYTQLLVTKQGNCIDAKFVNSELSKELPKVVYSKSIEQLSTDKNFCLSISKLPAEILNNYSITWHSDFKVELKSNKYSYIVLAQAKQLMQSTKFEKILTQVHKLFLHKVTEKERKWVGGLLADIRIRGRIIAKPLKLNK